MAVIDENENVLSATTVCYCCLLGISLQNFF